MAPAFDWHLQAALQTIALIFMLKAIASMVSLDPVFAAACSSLLSCSARLAASYSRSGSMPYGPD